MKTKTPQLPLRSALLPVVLLVVLLAYNVFVFGDDALSGSNQFILIIGGAIAAVVGYRHNVSYSAMLDKVAENVKSVTGALL
ncbi:MAG: sodium:proton antiporter, partial [Flavobacteriaceae bacterium]